MANPTTRPYKVRTSWEDSKTQLGSYAYVDAAKNAAIAAYMYSEPRDTTFKVFKDGLCIYNPEEDEDLLKPLFAGTKGAEEMENTIPEGKFIVVSETDGDEIPEPEVEEEPIKEHLSFFQKIKNIFRKK